MPTFLRIVIPLMSLLAKVTSEERLGTRADDPNPLEAVVNRLTQDVARLEARLAALENAKVTPQQVSAIDARVHALEAEKAKKAAFQATLDTDAVPNAPIHFKLVRSVGGGYDQVTGVYTAPFSGWYSFDVQVYPHMNSTDLFNMGLYKNGGLAAKAHCFNNQATSFTCNTALTLHVNAGDRLWVESTHTTAYWHGVFDNIFAGALVVPDD